MTVGRSDTQLEGGRVSPLRALGAVFAAFFGVRKSADRERDMANLTPVQVIIAGVIGAALFVATIVTLVKLITH